MSLLLLIILFALLGGVLSVLVAAIYLILPEASRNKLMPHLISFATGALLGAAFLSLLPHALGSPYITDVHHIPIAVLCGLLGFFLLEKMVLWRHCHTEECEVHGTEHEHQNNASGALILVGDSIHNFVDGVLITASFLVDVHVGIVTSLAVAAHEIPQEVGDFAILLHSGFSRLKAIIYNMLSSLTTVIGAVLAYYSLGDTQQIVPYILAIAAASFIYIAVSDLIPTLHKRVETLVTAQQILLIAAGVLVMYAAHSTLH